MWSSYQEMYMSINDEEMLINKRLEMVRFTNEAGVKRTAKFYKCSKNTVKKWARRYAILGISGLIDQSRKPKRSPKMIKQKDINLITETAKEAKLKKKYITVKNIRKKTQINEYSDATLNRYINKAVGKKKNRKHDSSTGGNIKWKTKLKPFELIQVDIKYLTDIDNLKQYFAKAENQYKGIRNKYQITARDVCTGAAIVSYCEEKSAIYTKKFLETILYPFLQQFKYLNLKKITIQTDNGFEFTNKRTRTKGIEPVTSIFTMYIEDKFKKHRINIPGHPTSDSEVESFHWSIERDCLAWDDIVDDETLIKYTTEYMQKYLITEIKTRGYSPLSKIKETYEIDNIIFPMPQIINL